jgi:SagB-type dehydrogenase family enzyme
LESELDDVYRYHDGTKHHFHQFARSPARLDWASQPRPFRTFHDTSGVPLFPAPGGARVPEFPHVSPVSYDQLFRSGAGAAPVSFTAAAVGDLLRHALGLSAWKQFRDARWSLRVNPSSGNLHPTEAYVVTGGLDGLSEAPSVFHYAADRHALERRCEFDAAAWSPVLNNACLVALTSIHWRESWKYGERAFRYCQHDLGHAIAAIRIAAALMGWRAVVLPEWPHADIETLTGIDRDQDYVEAEREDAGCLLAITVTGEVPDGLRDGRAPMVEAVRHGRWSGRASQLSEEHVQWTFIDEIARVTEDRGRPSPAAPALSDGLVSSAPPDRPALPALPAREIILQRRSAVAFDGRSSIGVDRFLSMMNRVLPGRHAPWDALWWTPRIHLVVFVHRVDGLDPGLYFLPRDVAVLDRIRSALRAEFLWDHVPPIFCLWRGDCRAVAARVSCGQDIASDGFFSLGMLAEFDRSLQEFGPAFYRHLFWESGMVGQMLYLDAEATGARATGIGCFFDDPVHDVLGLSGHAFQSLYHFTVGMPVEDSRLTTAPGYEWEQNGHSRSVRP